MIPRRRKHLTLACVGGFIYVMIELLWRGRSHWSMFVLGGLCFVLIGLINEIIPWGMPLWQQQLIGAVIVTILEFITGLIVNVWLGLNVWDYTNMPLNIMGQICLPFTVLWFFLAIPAIILDDYLRWKWYGEKVPRYRFEKNGRYIYPFRHTRN